MPRSGTTLVINFCHLQKWYGFGNSIFLNKYFDKNIFDKKFISKNLNKKTAEHLFLLKTANEIGNKYVFATDANVFH